jgi:hypothetical protein
MKKFILAALALFALTANAGDLGLGYNHGIAGSHSNSYKAAYNTSLLGLVDVGAELENEQASGEGTVASLSTANVGTHFGVQGFVVKPYVEVGRALEQEANATLWGAGVKVSHKLCGFVDAEVGYRHREAFNHTDLLKEDRLSAALSTEGPFHTVVGVEFNDNIGRSYAESGNNTLGVFVKHSF